jgi:IS5 family transposase
VSVPKGLWIKRGTIQDATFIEADPGKSKNTSDGVDKTRHSRDGIWTEKGKKSYFGYKLHQKKAILFTALFVKSRPQKQRCMTAELICQSKTKLSSEIEDILACLPKVVIFTIVRWTTDAPLGELDKERNRLISKLRSPAKDLMLLQKVFGADVNGNLKFLKSGK